MSHLNIYEPGSMKTKLESNTIFGFFGDYRWLSNFWPADIYLTMPNNVDYKFATTEAAYQANKSTDPKDWREFANLTSAKEAKYLGNKIKLRSDWELDRYDIMLNITRIKFAYPDLKARLLATGDKYLEETNNWKDTYWGVCNGVGLNNLGHILMKVREEIKQSIGS